MPRYSAYVRDLPRTIESIIKNACLLNLDLPVDWTEHLHLRHSKEFDAAGDRIALDWSSANDIEYVSEVWAQRQGQDIIILPIQFFIDKANVTKLNKRSMYPVVLYLICFSRKVRRRLAVNVAFVPVVKDISETGKRIPRAIGKQARATALQKTLSILLRPLTAELRLDVCFPTDKRVRVTPFLISIVADAPEAAVLLSSRTGVKTAYPCPRCYVPKEKLGSLDQGDVALKTAAELSNWYKKIEQLPTKGEQESFLKMMSLRQPASMLIGRFEFANEFDNGDSVTDNLNLSYTINPFGLPSLTKFESMHNLDLGITADLLRSIENYFAVLVNSTTATKIVDCANAHQGLLPRRSESALFRLPQLGTIIAPSHANLSAQNYRSALCVLPFLLNGSTRDFTQADEAMYDLLRLVLSYLRLHHFIRRINLLPWHRYNTVEEDLEHLLATFSSCYNASVGLTKTRDPGSGPAALPQPLSTLKSHQLFTHLLRDILGAGNVQNFDAESGESHHVDTRAQYEHTSKREGAEGKVAKRATTRELGVLSHMYPCEDLNELSVDRSVDNDFDDPPPQSRKRWRTKWTRIVSELLDDMDPAEFNQVLNKYVSEGYEEYVYRDPVSKLRIKQTIAIQARYPWVVPSENHWSLKLLNGRPKATSKSICIILQHITAVRLRRMYK